jgi:peptidoglycan hydrolase-like protein with peptidoglycan-binding domain
VARENEREAILQLQRFLRQLSYFDERIGAVPIDGIFDSDTEAALRAFQASVGLPQSGRADLDTWERLYAAYLSSVQAKSEPRRLAHFPQIPEDYTVEVGETQFLVAIIQNALHELSRIYEGLEGVPQSGVYDADTANAVQEFQRVYGLPPTGAVDRATWNALADAYNRNLNMPYSKE